MYTQQTQTANITTTAPWNTSLLLVVMMMGWHTPDSSVGRYNPTEIHVRIIPGDLRTEHSAQRTVPLLVVVVSWSWLHGFVFEIQSLPGLQSALAFGICACVWKLQLRCYMRIGQCGVWSWVGKPPGVGVTCTGHCTSTKGEIKATAEVEDHNQTTTSVTYCDVK